jgi:arabinose-5-phosphate isomerase
MKLEKNIQLLAKNVLKQEAEAITNLIDLIDISFENCVKHLLTIHGRLVVTGIGKSAIIAQKLVATFNSTGTASLFMHAADAIHGDLGMIQPGDSILVISKSGDTPELKVLIPLLKRAGNKLIGMVSNTNSYLAKHSDFVLAATITSEACPLNLAPTTSTTASLALGDALAVCLIEQRGFTAADFGKYHPGGAIGKKLYLKVNDIFPKNSFPAVQNDSSIKDVIVEISAKRLGITIVMDYNKNMVGVITDGDIRRMLDKYDDIKSLKAMDIMNKNPKTIEFDEYAINAFHYMQNNNITQLIALKNGVPAGIIHLHDLLNEGLV